MKKTCAIIAITMLSASVFAAPVPAEKLDAYKQGAEFALASANLKCKFNPSTDHWLDSGSDKTDLKELIDQATSADLDETGSQPVLTFSYSGGMVQSIAITTSADYKSIVEIDFSQYTPSSVQVNAGTIVNPNMVTKILQLDQMVAICK